MLRTDDFPQSSTRFLSQRRCLRTRLETVRPCSGPSLKVALLTPGAIYDQSWNAGAYQGLMRIRDSLGAQVSHIQTKTPAEFEDNFRQYGNQDYTIVFGHGFEYQDAAKRVAPEFPKTIYVTTSGTTQGQTSLESLSGSPTPRTSLASSRRPSPRRRSLA